MNFQQQFLHNDLPVWSGEEKTLRIARERHQLNTFVLLTRCFCEMK